MKTCHIMTIFLVVLIGGCSPYTTGDVDSLGLVQSRERQLDAPGAAQYDRRRGMISKGQAVQHARAEIRRGDYHPERGAPIRVRLVEAKYVVCFTHIPHYKYRFLETHIQMDVDAKTGAILRRQSQVFDE